MIDITHEYTFRGNRKYIQFNVNGRYAGTYNIKDKFKSTCLKGWIAQSKEFKEYYETVKTIEEL